MNPVLDRDSSQFSLAYQTMSGDGLAIGLDIGWLGLAVEGIRRWTLQTFTHLIEEHPQHTFCLIWPWPHEPGNVFDLFTQHNVERFCIRPRNLFRRIGRRIGLLNEVSRVLRKVRRLDLLFWDAYVESCFPWLDLVARSTPLISPVFDAVPLAFPETQPEQWILEWRKRYERIRLLGSYWLTISSHARSELVRLAGLDPDRGQFVYPGNNFSDLDLNNRDPGPLPLDIRDWLGNSPYLLTVGTIEPRKNHCRLFRAFAKVLTHTGLRDWKLLVIGGQGWLNDSILSEASTHPRILLAGRRDDRALAACYRHATGFVFPSLYEGFGFPVCEAMSFGLPILSSNSSSLPEVVGDAALLFDPESETELEIGLHRLMSDSELRASLARKARTRAAQFDWKLSARETMNHCQRIVQVAGL